MNPSLKGWSELELANARLWVSAWTRAGVALEEVRRRELRSLDLRQAISLLCGPADYRVPPRQARPGSGLVEQQRWFTKVARRD